MAGAGLAASDQDGVIDIATRPVSSVYPSTLIIDFEVGGTLYLAMTDTGQRRRATGRWCTARSCAWPGRW